MREDVNRNLLQMAIEQVNATAQSINLNSLARLELSCSGVGADHCGKMVLACQHCCVAQWRPPVSVIRRLPP